MNAHCLLTGHDVCMASLHADMLVDRCVHCGTKLPIGAIRQAFEALVRGVLVIFIVLCFAAARHAATHARAPMLPERDHEDQAAEDR